MMESTATPIRYQTGDMELPVYAMNKVAMRGAVPPKMAKQILYPTPWQVLRSCVGNASANVADIGPDRAAMKKI